MTQANPSHPYTLASRSKSLPASQNLPKSMVAQTHGRKESTGIQHCIKAIAGEVVKLSSVHLINFGGGGQVIALKSATALILDRCTQFEKINLHINRTISFRVLSRKTKNGKRKAYVRI
tara:strand:- start:53 stop:409 length:357 start_codon:yes stop_codon:yes gene_type:complete